MERKAIEGHAEEWLKAVTYIDEHWNQPNFLEIVPLPDVSKYFMLRNHFADKSRLINADSLKSECKELDKRAERLFKKGHREYSNFLKIFCNQFKQYYLNANDSDYSVFHAFLKDKNWTPLSVEDMMKDREEKRKEEERQKKEEEYRKYEQERKNKEEKQKREERKKDDDDLKWKNKRQRSDNGPVPRKAILLSLLSIVTVFVVYYFWYIPYATDRDAPRYYTFTNLNLRSSEVGEVEYNLLDLLPYGSELITYSVGDEWASVKAHGKKGFVSSSLILSSEDFRLLNSAWGNTDAKECVPTAKCRLAILDYYKRCNLEGGVEWQIYTKMKEDKPNTTFYPRIFDRNSKFTDFAFLVKNNQTKKRMFVIYSFDDETEAPVYRYDMEAPEEGYIKNIQGYYRYSSFYLTVTYSDGKRQTATLNVAEPLRSNAQRQQTVPSVQPTQVQSSSEDNTEHLSAEELNRQGDVYYDKKEFTKAVACYKKSAVKGYPEAFANLGWSYYKGLGVQADGAIAISYLKDGLELGNLNAGYYLGFLYENGLGNRFYDLDRALSAYKQVAFKGHKDAIKSLKRLADNGNRHACLYMGQIYKEGVNMEYKDLEQAIHYYKLAAEKGESEAVKALSELNVGL